MYFGGVVENLATKDSLTDMEMVAMQGREKVDLFKTEVSKMFASRC